MNFNLCVYGLKAYRI